jgi:hypothetical protein
MSRVSKTQSNSDVQIRSEADRGTEQVRTEKQRPRRNSIGSPKLSLAVQNEIPGYHLCWMNDDGNVENAVNSGYEFVARGETELVYGVTPLNVDLADKIKQKVGTNEAGHPLYAYLMKIKQEWHEEDMAEIAEENKRIEEAIAGGNINGSDGQDGRYTSNISIKRT